VDVLQVTVRAATEAVARDLAVQEARRGSFEPFRVLHVRPQGVQDGPGGVLTVYRVQMEGNALTESEARFLWGDR
jgi:hypothetical protein